MTTKKQQRKEKALKRLEAQLVSGVKKPSRHLQIDYAETVPLTDSDKNRINKEIEILKTRI